MQDGTYVSIICANDRDTDINFASLCTTLPGIGVVDGLPGNEILIKCFGASDIQAYSLNQIRGSLKRFAKVDMFDLITDPHSGMQSRNWYCLPTSIKQNKGKGTAA